MKWNEMKEEETKVSQADHEEKITRLRIQYLTTIFNSAVCNVFT